MALISKLKASKKKMNPCVQIKISMTQKTIIVTRARMNSKKMNMVSKRLPRSLISSLRAALQIAFTVEESVPEKFPQIKVNVP